MLQLFGNDHNVTVLCILLIWTTVSTDLECNKADLFDKDSFSCILKFEGATQSQIMSGVTQIDPQANVLKW